MNNFSYGSGTTIILTVNIGGKNLHIQQPTKNFYDRFNNLGKSNIINKYVSIAREILSFNIECEKNISEINIEEAAEIIVAYKKGLNIFLSDEKYNIPYYPSSDKEKTYFSRETVQEKLVSDYSGLNFIEIENLPIDVYLLLMRDAFIFNCEHSKSGKEYLYNAWRITQTSPEIDKLEQTFGRK